MKTIGREGEVVAGYNKKGGLVLIPAPLDETALRGLRYVVLDYAGEEVYVGSVRLWRAVFLSGLERNLTLYRVG